MSYRISTAKTWHETDGDIAREFRRWGALRGRAVKWSVANLRGRSEVALTYQHDGEPEVRLEMTSQGSAEANYRVLFLAVEALRLNEARGIADVLRAAYLALPSPTAERDPFEVLGVRSDAPAGVIDAAYIALAKAYHPDTGSTPDAAKMAEVNRAYDRTKVKA